MRRVLCCAVWLVSTAALAQTQIKGRVLLIVDTSGSMGFYFRDPATFAAPPTGDYPGGDGSLTYTDRNQTNAFMFPGKRISGTCTQANPSGCEGLKSRLFAAKAAVVNTLNGYGGNIDFGLETFDFQLCSFNAPLCEQCVVTCSGFSCSYSCLYADNAFTTLRATNWISQACSATGARVITAPGPAANAQILPWVDNVEDHRSSGDGNNNFGTGSSPLNPELRAEGPTPLAASLNVARAWYDSVKITDPQQNCRPYAVVLLTDGVESCGGDPVAAATALYNDNPTNRVKVYVVGVAVGTGTQAPLDSIASAGGTGSARLANSQAEIESAMADIASSSVKIERCNNLDDNCNGQTDEGFNKGASCNVGSGACRRTGIFKCTAAGAGTQCCVNDGNPNGPCTQLSPGAPSAERCNGLDDDCNGLIDDGNACACNPTAEICDGRDNDCNGTADDSPIDVGKPCGSALGTCRPGVSTCANGALTCPGSIGPSTPACNGCDNDCDGTVDRPTQLCYSGPPGTLDAGVCRAGLQSCTASGCPSSATWSACTGEVLPTPERCNGLDDDCDTQVDNVPGAGGACCPSGRCDAGICRAGALACAAGAVACIGAVGPGVESCDGLDNDCDGTADNLAGLGTACQTQTGCAGATACDVAARRVVCAPATGAAELCNGLDDDCNGLIDDALSDARLGQACGMAVCMMGTTVCRAGQVVCDGVVVMRDEVCDGKDNDCDQIVDEGATCPAGSDCLQGGCYAPCGPGCPGGYVCDATNHCVPGSCQCAACQKCREGACVDFCSDVDCGPGYQCDCGVCNPIPNVGGTGGGAGTGGGSAGGAGGGTGGGEAAPKGCGCDAASGWPLLAALALIRRRRRGGAR